jgi:hypothetical protein
VRAPGTADITAIPDRKGDAVNATFVEDDADKCQRAAWRSPAATRHSEVTRAGVSRSRFCSAQASIG